MRRQGGVGKSRAERKEKRRKEPMNGEETKKEESGEVEKEVGQ